MRRRLLSPLFAALAFAVTGCGSSHAADGSPAAASTDAHAAPPGGATTTPPPAPPSENVRIVMTVIPATATAKVLLGKKLLGVVPPRKPLVLVRPRDSGPLDVLVRADGFLPVQTRIYTFADSKLGVKLTAPEDKKTLLGYREPPPPETPPAAPNGAGGPPGNEQPMATPDGGAAP